MIRLIGMTLLFLIMTAFVGLVIYGLINGIISSNDYKTKVFAGNEVYFVKEEPVKINEKCWLITTYYSERFYCGEIYIKYLTK